jgi:peptide deformylase
MLRAIVRFGDGVLHEPARNVEQITPEITTLIDDMIETMYAAPGIGLAAPQVGVPLRVFVIDLSVGRDRSALITMVNPVFVEQEGLQLEDEGCLSIPGFNATVARPQRAIVRGIEMDHLDGRLFVDRLRGIKRDLIVRKIRKLARTGQW